MINRGLDDFFLKCRAKVTPEIPFPITITGGVFIFTIFHTRYLILNINKNHYIYKTQFYLRKISAISQNSNSIDKVRMGVSQHVLKDES